MKAPERSNRFSIVSAAVCILLTALCAGCGTAKPTHVYEPEKVIIVPETFEDDGNSAKYTVKIDPEQLDFGANSSLTLSFQSELLSEDGRTPAETVTREAVLTPDTPVELQITHDPAKADPLEYTIRLTLKNSSGKELDRTELKASYHTIQLTERAARLIVPYLTAHEKACLVVGNNSFKHPGASGATYVLDRFGIPEMAVNDGPAGIRYGNAVAYPCGANLANTWNVDTVWTVGEALGRDTANTGIDILLAPGVNIHRNPLCGRNAEYFSEDPLVAGYIAMAYVRGVQSQGIGVSVKHFATNNQETDRGSTSTIVTERALREIYLTPFEIAVREADPATIMSSYNCLNNYKHTGTNAELLTGILRGEWGFRGLVMTDWGEGGDRAEMINAQNDLIMPGTGDFQTVLKLIESGAIDMEALDRCCENILNVIAWTKENRVDPGENVYERDLRISQQAAEESFVLLKNDGGALPVTGEIALFGNGQVHTEYYPHGSGMVYVTDPVSIREGIENSKKLKLNQHMKAVYGDCYQDYGDVLNPEDDVYQLVPETGDIEVSAKTSKAAVIVITRSTTEGEDHRNRAGDFMLSRREAQLIERVSDVYHAAGRKVIVLLNVGNPIEVASWRDMVDAILYIGYPGTNAGDAVANVLSGAVSPSGKLNDTFPISYSDVPSSGSFPGDPRRTVYDEDIYVGYRYYETFGIETAYPFGYGLSYTTFSYSDLKISGAEEIGTNRSLTVSVKVKNTGKIAGREVVQIYLTKPGTGAEQPVKVLAGFAKTGTLKPGRSETVTVELSEYGLRYYDPADSAWKIEAGAYTVLCAASVNDVRLSGRFSVPDPVLVKDVDNRCVPVDEFVYLTRANYDTFKASK